MVNHEELRRELQQYSPITLDQMQSVALLKRVEVKYVLPRRVLPSILAALRREYAVLEVAGQRLNRYRTLYFDTDDFAMYRRHHAGAADRFKVRARTYLDSATSFLEVKHKTNKRRVVKERMPTPALVTTLDDDAAAFVDRACPYAVDTLRPAPLEQLPAHHPGGFGATGAHHPGRGPVLRLAGTAGGAAPHRDCRGQTGAHVPRRAVHPADAAIPHPRHRLQQVLHGRKFTLPGSEAESLQAEAAPAGQAGGR